MEQAYLNSFFPSVISEECSFSWVGTLTDAHSDMNKTQLHDSDSGAELPHLTSAGDRQRDAGVWQLRWLIRGSSRHWMCLLNEAGEQSQPQAPIPPSLRASEVFILGNGSVNVDKLSRGIYSIMCSFLKLPLNERLWMGKGSEILPLLCHQNGTVLINPVSPGRIFKFLFIL